MAQEKKTFIFYSDWRNMIREMPDADAGALLKHVLSYVNDENPETENLLVKMAFGHMKPLLKEDLDKWEAIRGKRKIAGSKGGKASAKQKTPIAKQVEAVNDNVNVNVNDNVNVNVIEKRKKDFEKSLTLFCEKYDPNDLKDFYEYWTEHGANDKKMRFEKEKSFGLQRRLATWMKNKVKFDCKEDKRVTVTDGIAALKSGQTFLVKPKHEWL